MILQKGYVYYLKGFTAPKLFNGNGFVCLLTEQVISRDWDISLSTGVHISEWQHNVYNQQRFSEFLINSPQRVRIRSAIDEAMKQLNPLLTDQYKRPGQ